MSNLRRTDIRFVLPSPVRRALVLGGDGGWAEALQAAGIAVSMQGQNGAGAPDLTVAPPAMARAAAATGAPAVLLDGPGGGAALRRAGYAVRRYLALPRRTAPDVLLPLGDGAALRAVFGDFRPAESAVHALRNRAVRVLAARDVLPDAARVQTVGLRVDGPPAALTAAGGVVAGLDPNASWFLSLGGGDRLSRAVFHCMPRGTRRASHVVKFARVAGYVAPFEREQRVFDVLQRSPASVQAHAPRLLARAQADGLELSVESAAAGRTLAVQLCRASRREGRALVDTVAQWILDVARDSAAPPPALQPELARLGDEVLPAWREQGADAALLDSLPPLPAVLQHNDLGTWNVIGDGGTAGFTAIDWESAREHGLPVWDLLYFLVDALARLDGATTPDQRAAHAPRLLRGELPSSAHLFHWVRRGAEASGVPAQSVGAVATLCWLSHGLSHRLRWQAGDAAGAGGSQWVPPVERLAPVWLADPVLGPGWDRWRA